MLFEIRYGPLLNVRTTTEVPEIQDLQHPKLTAPPLQPKPLGQIVGSISFPSVSPWLPTRPDTLPAGSEALSTGTKAPLRPSRLTPRPSSRFSNPLATPKLLPALSEDPHAASEARFEALAHL